MMSMTPKEIVHMAMARARTDMIEDLRVNEFIYCFPIEKVDYSMLESLCRFSFERLVGVCAKVRKGDRGKSDRYVELGEFRFMLSKCPHGHLVVMDSEDPLMLKWIPEDMDELFFPKVNRFEGGWEVSYEVPYSFVRRFFPEFEVKSGKVIRANCFKCAEKTSRSHFITWNPVRGGKLSFHRPDCFGEMEFE